MPSLWHAGAATGWCVCLYVREPLGADVGCGGGRRLKSQTVQYLGGQAADFLVANYFSTAALARDFLSVEKRPSSLQANDLGLFTHLLGRPPTKPNSAREALLEGPHAPYKAGSGGWGWG